MGEGDQNVVFIGAKSSMKYALSAKILSKQGNNEVKFVARGKNISNAASACLLALRMFLDDWKVKRTQISEAEQERNGKKIYVPSIEIVIGKISK